MADADAQAGLISQCLKFALPQSDAGSVGAAAISGDHHPVGAGIAAAPIFSHHSRTALTANWAVSWVTPTLTQPVLSAMS